MNLNKKKKDRLIPAGIIFCAVYIIFSFKPMNQEIHFTPEWTVNISQVQGADSDEEPVPFKLGKTTGFFTGSGKIITSLNYDFKAAISDKIIAPYNSDNTATDLFNYKGTKICTIREPGFPFLDSDRIYLMPSGGNSFKRISADGTPLWNYEYYCPITAFASSSNGTTAGYADGTLIAFDNSGKITQKFSPGGSNTEVILGAAISEDGNMVACVSGLDQQRFIAAEKSEGHSRIIFHEYLGEQINRQTIVKFNKNADVVYYNFKNGLGIVNLKKSASLKIPVKGMITQIEFSDDGDLVYILSRDGNTYTVTVLEKYVYQMATFSFTGESAFIQTRDNALFIGHNNKISKISISKK